MGPFLAGITARFGCLKLLAKMKHFYADDQLLKMAPLVSRFCPKFERSQPASFEPIWSQFCMANIVNLAVKIPKPETGLLRVRRTGGISSSQR